MVHFFQHSNRCCLLLFILSVLGQHVTSQAQDLQDYLCNGYFDRVQNRCSYVSKTPVTWDKARAFCHSRHGWLINSPSKDNSENAFLGSKLLASNGVETIWTGTHVNGDRLLDDNFPTTSQLGQLPKKPVAYNVTSQAQCVVEKYVGLNCASEETAQPSISPVTNSETNSERPQRKKRALPSTIFTTSCTAVYARILAPCDQKHHFGCYFAGSDQNLNGGFVDRDGVQVYETANFPYQVYLTKKTAPYNNSDSVCGEMLAGGTTFRVRTFAGRTVISGLALYLGELSKEESGYSQDELDKRLFWVVKSDSRCDAVSLSKVYSLNLQGDATFSMTSWPCEVELPVLCQVDREYAETKSPSMTPLYSGQVFQFSNGEIRGSLLAFNIHLSSNQSDTFLTLNCELGPFKDNRRVGQDVQGVTIFRSGVPIHVYNRRQQGERTFPTTLQISKDWIDFLDYYHCETNDMRGNRLLTSNRIFLRVTGFEVYSLHIGLNRTVVSDKFEYALHVASLVNTLSVYSDGEAKLLPNRVPNRGNLFVRLRRLLGNQNQNWQIKPLLFLPRSSNSTAKLVFYIYPLSSDREDREDVLTGKLSEFDARLRQMKVQYTIRALLVQSKGTIPELNTTSAEIQNIDWCWAKDVNHNVTNRMYSLPNLPGDALFSSPQTCAQDGQPLVTVRCQGDKRRGFHWGPVVVNPLCDYSGSGDGVSPITDSLQSVSQETVMANNVEIILNKTEHLIKSLDRKDIRPMDVNFVADVLQKAVAVNNVSRAAVQTILDTAQRVADLKVDVLDEASKLGKATNRILKSMDEVGNRINLSSSTNERIISGPFAMEVWKLSDQSATNTIVGLKVLSDGKSEIIRSKDLVQLFSADNFEYDNAELAILLPKDLIMATLKNQANADIRLGMNVYKDTTLYTASASETDDGKNTTLNSKVIAAQLLINGRQMIDIGLYKVIAIFMPKVRLPTENRSVLSVCAYWDFAAKAGAGGWSSDGCSYNRTEAGRDVCVCGHLTNFAVLMNFYDQEKLDNDHSLALTIITIVGLGLSIAGLSVSILSFMCIKKLRQGRPQQTLFHLAVSLLLSWIVFLVGINQTESHAGCIAVAAILHYLIMASFMWMLMEGILQYLLFVRVMNTYFSKYMLKTALPAWGLPILPVVIVLAIDPELYSGGRDYCWMSLDAFYFAFALPVGLIILTNLVIFILVMVSLCRRKDMSQHSSQSKNQTMVNIRASFICFFILGISWVFGFLTIEDAHLVFQYIFCIFASLQGFAIFLMMTARDKNIRHFWKSFCSKSCGRASKKDRSDPNWDRKGNAARDQSGQHVSQDKSSSSFPSNSTQTTTSTGVSETDGSQQPFVTGTSSPTPNQI